MQRHDSPLHTFPQGPAHLPAGTKAPMYNKGMQDLVRELLASLGEDPDREGLINTPKRVEQALKFLTSGYTADIDDVLNNALFTVDYSEMVIVKDIDFYSLCEHHLLPFFGRCHVAYIPSTKVIGLSKIPRLVDVFSRRLQVQERLTNQIADTIREKIAPIGVAVVVEATHLCMSMRGVEKQNSFAVTSAMLGAFRDRARTRMEFLELLKLRSVPPPLRDPTASFACMVDD
jgi:GTP cyclohydrolase IA